MAKLTFLLDDGQEIVVPLGERVSVGRENGNDVLVDDPRISARHAEITRDGAGVFEVRDLSSKLGTFVNGEKVSRKFLTPGDKVEFGPLKSVFDGSEPRSAPHPNGGTTQSAETKTQPPAPTEAASVKKKKKKEATVPPPAIAEPVAIGEKEKKTEKIVSETETARPAPIPAEALAAAVREALEKMPATEREAIERLKAKRADAQQKLDSLGEDLGVLSKQRADSMALGAQEKRQLQEQLSAAAAAVAREKQLHQELYTARATDEARLKQHTESAETKLQELKRQLQATTAEIEARTATVHDLAQEETRLSHVTGALKETQAKHAHLSQELDGLTELYSAKYAEWQRVTSATENTARELETMGIHREKTEAHIQSMIQQTEMLDGRLKELHAENTTRETRAQDLLALAEARHDQIKSSEKKLQTLDNDRSRLEGSISELSGYEEKLKQTREQHREAAAQHAELTTLLAALTERHGNAQQQAADLETRIRELQEQHQRATQSANESAAAQERVEHNLERIQAERAAHEKDLTTTRSDLIAERQRLAEIQKQHQELARKCADLADTDQKLGECKAALEQHEAKVAETTQQIAELEKKHTSHSSALEDLLGMEESTRGRLETLRGQEKDLRDVLAELGERERENREKFEEIRKLASEAEQGSIVRKEELRQGTEEARRELSELEIRLAPLRDWKDAMDKRYARLAALPEDSSEARDLWREIEGEKANLRNLIPASAGQIRSVSLREAVLKNLNREQDADGSESPAGPSKSKGILHAPPALSEEAETPEERANVGTTGTGALISGTGQEMALKARLNRLRESVQREAVRLEFIRQERAREEARGQQPSGPAGPMMREQGRQLASKVRQNEEQLATVQRKIEMAEVEEEKRREKITEMERKLAELKMDIAETERQRSDLRHQTNLAQTELRNYESALERVKKMAE